METPETPQNPEEETPQSPPKQEMPEKTDAAPQLFQPDKPGITLNTDAKYFLYTAGRWATFLGIMGFILSGLIALCAIFAGAVFSTFARMGSAGAVMPAGVGGLITVIYLVFAVVHFFFALYLYQFGAKIKDGITYMNEPQVTIALGKLKSFFKFWGILVIVIISLYILIIIGVIIAAPMLKNSIPVGNAYSFILF